MKSIIAIAALVVILFGGGVFATSAIKDAQAKTQAAELQLDDIRQIRRDDQQAIDDYVKQVNAARVERATQARRLTALEYENAHLREFLDTPLPDGLKRLLYDAAAKRKAPDNPR